MLITGGGGFGNFRLSLDFTFALPHIRRESYVIAMKNKCRVFRKKYNFWGPLSPRKWALAWSSYRMLSVHCSTAQKRELILIKLLKWVDFSYTLNMLLISYIIENLVVAAIRQKYNEKLRWMQLYAEYHES